MIIAPRQFVQTSTGNVGATTLSVTLSNVLAGSTLVVWCAVDDAGGPADPTVSDPANGVYPAVYDKIDDTTNTQVNWQTRKENVAASASLVVTCTWGASLTFRGLAVAEIGGCATSSVLDGHAAVLQVGPGTGTDAVKVGPPSPNNINAPALICAFLDDTSGTAAPTQGTGYTSQGTAWDFASGTNGVRFETLRITGASSAATATTTGGGDRFINMEQILNEFGIGGGGFIRSRMQPLGL